MNPTKQEFSEFPVRPAMQTDEWKESHLVRVARANGLRSPTKDDIDRLRNGCTFDETALANVGSDYLSEIPGWARKKLGSPIRYCPACFHKEKYVRARWRLSPFDVCTLHNLNLKRGLVEPGLSTSFNYSTAIRIHEIDDAQIWEGATCPMPDARAHAVAMWSEFESELSASRFSEARETLAWALIAEHLLDAVVTLGSGPEVPIKGESRTFHRSIWLRGADIKLKASKEGVLNFLLGIKLHSQRRAAAACLDSILKDRGEGSTLFANLPLQYLYDRLIGAAPEIHSTVSYGVLPRDLHPEGYVSIHWAEGVLGKSNMFVTHLVRANFFEKVIKIKFGRRIYVFIEKSEVEGCRRWLSGCMTAREVQQHLQIDMPMYTILKRCKILQPIEISSWVFYRRDDIVALTIKLENFARPYPSNRNQFLPILGNWNLGMGKSPYVCASLLEEILEGRLPVYRKIDERGLKAYYVDAVAVNRTRQINATRWTKKGNRVRQIGQLSLLDTPC